MTDLPKPTDPFGERRPGARLREAREAANRSIESVAASLLLDRKTIEAIEADAFDRLSAPTFVRGYLRSYARELGIPADPILEMYDRHGFEPPPLAAGIAEAAQAHTSDTVVRLVTYAVAAVLVVLVGLWWHGQEDRGFGIGDYLFSDSSDSAAEAPPAFGGEPETAPLNDGREGESAVATFGGSPEASRDHDSTIPSSTEVSAEGPSPAEDTAPGGIAAETPALVEDTTPDTIAAATPALADDTTPGTIAAATPDPDDDTTPGTIAAATPDPDDDTTPRTIAAATPAPDEDATTGTIAAATPAPDDDTAPGTTAAATPAPDDHTTPGAIAAATPAPDEDTTPGTVAAATPALTDDTTPGTIAAATPALTDDTTPGTIAAATPAPDDDTTPGTVAAATPALTDDTTPGTIAAATPALTDDTTPGTIAAATPAPNDDTTPDDGAAAGARSVSGSDSAAPTPSTEATPPTETAPTAVRFGGTGTTLPQSAPAVPGTGTGTSTAIAAELPGLVLEFAHESWVEVYDSERTRLFFGLVEPGQVLDFDEAQPFDVLLGFGKDVRVTIDGEAFDHTPYIKHGVARFKVGTTSAPDAESASLDASAEPGDPGDPGEPALPDASADIEAAASTDASVGSDEVGRPDSVTTNDDGTDSRRTSRDRESATSSASMRR